MTNREILNRIKKCFTNFKWPGGYEELALTNRDAFESLISDLLRDAHRDEQFEKIMKHYKMSTYGIYALCPCCHRSCLEMTDDDYIINDGKIITKKAVVLGPSKTNGHNIESVTVDEYSANDVKFIERIMSKDVKPKVMFNGPATIFQYGNFKTVVKCDEEDKFDRLVGLGVALYRYYRQHINYKKQYQTLSYFMDLDELAHYALHEFCDHSVNKKGNLAKELKKHDEGTWITLDI